QMRALGNLFPMFFVGVSNVAGSRFAKIADDLCLGHLLSFCIPLLLRHREDAPIAEMKNRAWLLIVVTTFSIGGMTTFASIYPAEAAEELLMFMNSTFPDSDIAVHQFVVRWFHNFAPYGAGLSTQLIPQIDQKATLLVSLTGLAVCCSCSLVAVLSSQGTVWQGVLLIVARNLIFFFSSFGFGAAATFCGDVCHPGKLRLVAIASVVSLTMGQITGGLIANLMNDHVERLWWLFFPPHFVLIPAFYLILNTDRSPHSYLRNLPFSVYDQSKVKEASEYYLNFLGNEEALNDYVNHVDEEVKRNRQEKEEIERESAICSYCCKCASDILSKGFSYFKFSPITSPERAKGFLLTFLSGMSGLVIQIELIKRMMSTQLLKDILPSGIYFTIIAITVVSAGFRDHRVFRYIRFPIYRYMVGIFNQIIVDFAIAVSLGADWDSQKILSKSSSLLLLISISILVYCLFTLPMAVLFVHNFSTLGHGTLWFTIALSLSRFLVRFCYSGLVKSERLTEAWAYGIFFCGVNYFVLFMLVVILKFQRAEFNHGVIGGYVPLN
ncbi:hypothetical protein PENTCL1PPCAC_21146, partial [Pristionchus entomophagus]